MRNLLVILVHDQAQYAERIADAICEQSLYPDGILVMLDRPQASDIVSARRIFGKLKNCSVKSVYSEPPYLGHPQMTDGVKQFCSGYVRNTAIEYSIKEQYGAVIFIDGDCIPGKLLVESHARMLSGNSPIITVGRRNEVKHGFRDQREIPANLIPIFKGDPYRVTEEEFFADSGVVWTCNVGLNMAAIGKLREINRTLFGRAEVFSSDFTGTWGGEDGYLGLECLYGGVSTMTLPESDAGVLHIEHPRPLDIYDPTTFIAFLEEKRVELMHLLNAFGYGTGGYDIRTYSEIVGDRQWRKK